MAPDSADSVVAFLERHAILDDSRLDELKRALSRGPGRDPGTMTREMVRRKWLTPYQADELIKGESQNLVLGSYLVLDRLGEGGMGEVFRARHRRLGREVAVKRMRPNSLASPEAVRRFRREVELAARVNHPNVVRALDAEEADGMHLLVMEFVHGRDLARLVKSNHPLPVGAVCEWMSQVGLGLEHAHELGLIHRDIKPSNLILTEDQSVVKILDLGLARIHAPTEPVTTSAITRLGAVIGTPDFISPEQALNASAADPRSDLYSLGCTFYLLLAGRPPFPGGTPVEKIMKHQMDECRAVEHIRPDVPAEVAGVIRRLMAKDPNGRYQTAGAFVAALAAAHGIQKIRGHAAVAVRPASAPPVDSNRPSGFGQGKSDLGSRIDELWQAGLAGSSVGVKVALARLRSRAVWQKVVPTIAMLTIVLASVIAILWPGRPSRPDVSSPESPPAGPTRLPDRPGRPKEIDLLRLLRPERDVVRGTWVLDNEGLVAAPGDAAAVKLPAEPGPDYILRVTVSRTRADSVGAFLVGVVVAGRQVTFAVDREGGTRSGLEFVDGARSSTAPGPHEIPFLPAEKECELVVTVHRRSVRATIDDVLVAEFEGDAARLSNPPDEPFPAPCLYLATRQAAVRVTVITLKPLGSDGAG